MHRKITLKSLLPTSISSLSFLLYPLPPILSNPSHQFDDLFHPSESLLKERYLVIFHHSVRSPVLLSFISVFYSLCFHLWWSLVQCFSYILFHSTLPSILLYFSSLPLLSYIIFSILLFHSYTSLHHTSLLLVFKSDYRSIFLLINMITLSWIKWNRTGWTEQYQ